jgi:hypothetical protein
LSKNLKGNLKFSATSIAGKSPYDLYDKKPTSQGSKNNINRNELIRILKLKTKIM